MPSNSSSPSRPPLVLSGLTLGFAAATAMWVVGYLTHFPGFAAPKVVTAALMALCQLGAGVLATRWLPKAQAWAPAALGGLIASLINLMIIGSLVGEEGALREGWIAMVGGTLLFGPLAAVIGCGLGQALPERTSPALDAVDAYPPTRLWLARFARLAPFATLPVLFSGGLVTTFDAGLAVHDWPGTYDAMMFLFPLQDMTGGIYYEHAHRLFGALAGLTVLALLGVTLAFEHRRWVKTAVVIAFIAVCIQGVLGGVGVTAATDSPHAIAEAMTGAPVSNDFAAAEDTGTSKLLRAVHGATGQLTFVYLCIVASFMSIRWRRAEREGVHRADRALRAFAAAAAHLLVIQLIVGVVLRHYENPMGSLHLHITLAAVLAVAVGLAGFRASSEAHAGTPILRILGLTMVTCVGLQIALGFGAMFVVLPTYQDPEAITRTSIVMATLHHMNGVALIAAAWLLEVWSRRLVAKRLPDQAEAGSPSPDAEPAGERAPSGS